MSVRKIKPENKYGFVYLWFDKKHKRYYIGCHWGGINDGYICSSSWMKQAYKRRPQDFKRRILKTNILDRQNVIIEENRYLQMIKKEELGKRYYNMTNYINGHWSTKDNTLSISEKMSLAKKKFYENGGVNHFTGKTHTEEVKKIIREKRKLQITTEKTKKIMSDKFTGTGNPFSNKTHSVNTKEIIRQKSIDMWKDPAYREKRKKIT